MSTENVGLVAVSENATTKVAVKSGGKVKAQVGTKYLLQVENSNVAPENVSVKRVGKDLQVFLNGSEEPELVIQDYFAEGMDTQLYGAAEDGQLYSYVRADGESFLLADGELEPIVLGTSSLGTAPLAYAGMESAGSALLWPLLAGAGVVGVATATRSSNSNHHGLLLQAPAKLAISSISNDNDPLHPSNIAHNSATNDPTPVVSGSGATPGDIIHVLDNGNEIGSTTANADGSWSFVPDLPLDDGTHDIVVIDEDPATHEKSEPSDPYTIIVDTNAPDVPAISDVINERDVGGPIHVEPNGLTSGSTPVISGVGAEPGDTIHVMDNGSEIGTAVVEPDGSWSFTPGSPLADGAHELSVSAEDPAGNRSDPSAPYPITIDTSPLIADLWFDALAGDDIINAVEATSVVVVSGGSSGARAGDMVIVTFGELSYSSTVDADGRWSVNVPGSELVANEPPRIYCTLFATDAAGNEVSVSTFHMYTVDLIPPDAPTIDSVANNNDPEHPIDVAKDGSTNDNTPVLSGEAEPGSTVHVYDNGVELGTAVADKDGTWSYEVPVDKALADGEHDFTVIAVDAGGNPSVPSNDYPVVIDTDPPTPDTSHLTIDAVAGNDLVNQDKAAQQQTISGHASGEFQAGDIVRFELNDTSYSAAVDASGDWSVQVAGSDLAAETNIHATLEAHDLAGNVGMIDADRPYTVNLTPPLASLSIDIVAGDDIVNIAEAAVDQAITGGSTGGRAGDVVKVIVNHITYSGTIDANGDWSISVPGAELVADELHIINATLDATNVAGNHATVTAEHAYSVDIIPPVATLTINVVAGDDIVNIAESKVNQTISGKVVGEFKAGDLVSFTLNGTDYSATVRATGDWNVSVAGSDLAAETNIHATLVAHDTAGNSASIVADHAYAVDLIAPEATLTINVVAGDDILNLAESQTSQTISGKVAGEFLPNDLVTFTLNGTTYSAAVNASGDWSVPVAGSDLAKESNIHATLIAHDVAGNSSTVVADHGYVVKLIPEDVTLTIDTVAGDDIVNLAESQTSQTISGKAIGSFTAGDLVTFTLDGTDYSAQVNASGAWSVQVPGSALAGDPGLNIHATLVAHDDVGNVNTVTADHAYRVDTVPPVATLTINVVAGDDIVNLAESKVNQTISGKVGGEFSVGDLVSFTLNGTDYSAAVRATGDWSVSVAGSDLAAETNIHATLVAHDTAGNSANVVADHGYAVDLIPPVATLSINVVAGDDVVNASEAMTNQSISGKAGGEFLAGDVVSFTLNGTAYSAAVNASGDWSVVVSGTDLAKGNSIEATLVAHDIAGNSSSVPASHPYTVDLIPPVATLSIDPVTADNILNLEESKVSQTISGKAGGEFLAGDVVSFTLNGTTYSAAVNASGDWSVSVPGSDLAKADNIHATLVAHDAAGNSANAVADHPYTVMIDPGKATLSIDVVAGDDILNLVESQTNQTISGKASGEFKAGDIVSFTLNGHAYSAAVSASGDWNVSVSGADLAKETNIHATLVAHDSVGNSSTVTADHGYSVDLIPPVATLSINPVTADNILNLEESKVSQTISGKASGEFLAGDVVSFTLNGTTYSAAVNASGDWSVSVPGSDLAKADNIHATLVAHDAAGNSANAVADHPYTVMIDPGKATLSIDVVAGDDILNLVESQTNQTISGKASGEFKAGDVVSFTLNGHAYSAAVSASGDWNVSVAGSDLAKETNIHATLVAHDSVGNSSTVTADHGYSVDLIPPVATLSINPVTADNILNLEESKVSQTISGKASGEFLAGDVVSFTLNGTTYSAAVNASGDWSVSVPGSDLAKANNIHATLVAHDAAGNVGNATADHPYTVMVDPGKATLSIDVVAGDDILNAAEAATNQTISGKAGGEFKAGDVVSFTLNGHAYSAAVSASGDWNVSVAGSDLAKETNIHATLAAHDSVGNSSTAIADHGYTVDLVSTTPVITSVYDDVGPKQGNLVPGETTDDARPKISGTAEANSTVTIYDKNVPIGSTTADGSGNWSFTPSKDLADGTHDITAKAVDVAGNTSAPSNTFDFIVATAPIVPTAAAQIDSMDKESGVSLSDWLTNNGDAGRLISGTINGTLNAGDKVQVSTDGGSTWSDAYVSGNKWDAMDPNAHSSSWNIQTRVVASDGVTAGPLRSQAVTLDTVPPENPTSLSYSSGVAKVGFNGAGLVAGDQVDVIVAGKHFAHTLTASEIAVGSANVSVTGASSVADLRAGLVDRAGNVSNYLMNSGGKTTIDFQNYKVATSLAGVTVSGVTFLDSSSVQSMKANNQYMSVFEGRAVTTANWFFQVFGKGLYTENTLQLQTPAQYFNFDFDPSQMGSTTAQYFDASGNLLGSLDLSLTPTETFRTYSFTSPGAPIASIKILNTDYVGVSQYRIDNIVYGDTYTIVSPELHQTVVAGSSDYYGGLGDNVFDVANVSTLSSSGVHGGVGGTDTLKLTGAGQTLDVSSLISAGKLDHIEVLDITGSGNNTVNLKIGDVLNLGEKNAFVYDGKVQLMVKGNAGDVVNLNDKLPDGIDPGDWAKDHTEFVGGVAYDVYRFTTSTGTVFNNAELLVQQGVTVNLTTGYSATRMALPDSVDDVSSIEHLAAASTDAQAEHGQPQQPEAHVALDLPGQPDSVLNQAHEIHGVADSFYGANDSYVSLSNAEAYLASDANQGIHGAAGVDTLAVAGHDQVLDLTAAHGKVTGMEVIDLTGDGQAHNSLKLSLEDVLDNGQADLFHTGDSHSVQMLVKGDSSDVVNLDHHSSNGTDSTWSDKGTVALGDISYHVYQNSSTEAELLIQQGVQVHLV